MALTRKKLREILPEITQEQEDAIITEHTSTVNPLKNASDTLQSVQAELDEIKAGDWQTKYTNEHNAFEAYKSEITTKETKAAKEKAVRAYLKDKGVSDSTLDVAMLASAAQINEIELDGDTIKDTTKLDDLLSGALASLITSEPDSKEPEPAKDEQNSGKKTVVKTGGGLGGQGKAMTKDEIMAIKDTEERQQAIAENLSLFEK